MAVPSVASSLSAAGVPAAKKRSATGNNAPVTQADFLNLLTTQMQFQGPTNPITTTDSASQLAQFSSLQGVQQLNTRGNQLMMLQQVSQASNLIGKQITFTSNGKSLATSGVVKSVQINNGTVQLMVGNTSVSLSQVTSIAAGSGN